MFKKLTLSNRIYLTQALIIVLMVVVGWIGIQSLDLLNQRINSVIRGEASEIRLSGKVIEGVLSTARAEKNLIIAETQQEMEQYAEVMRKRRITLDQQLGQLDGLVSGDSRYNLQRFQEIYREYLTVSDQVVALSLKNSNQEAADLSQQGNQQLIQRMIERIEKLRDSKEAEFVAQMGALQSTETQVLDQLKNLERNAANVLDLSRLASQLLDLQNGEKSIILSHKQEDRDRYAEKIDSNERQVSDIRDALLGRLDTASITEIDAFSKEYGKWGSTHERIRALANEESNTAAQRLSSTRSRGLQNAAEDQLRSIIQHAEERLEHSASKSDAGYNQSLTAILTSTAVAILVGIMMGVLLARVLNRRIQSLVNHAEQIASGNIDSQTDEGEDELSRIATSLGEITVAFRRVIEVAQALSVGNLQHRISARSEHDPLANAINQMGDNLQEIASQADTIALGDFTTSVVVRSENDQLGLAMQNIIRTLKETAEVVEAVAEGDLTMRVVSKGENDLLSTSVNRMIESQLRVVNQANTIAQGDFTADISPRSERDELGAAMRQMTANLRSAVAVSERNAWLQEGVAQLNNALRGQSHHSTMASRVMEQLCRYLNAQVGTLYIRRDLDEKGMILQAPELVLIGSYAYSEGKNLPNKFKFGESLVGQAALEGKPIRISNVPDDYVKVSSGLGESNPHHLIVVPFLFEEEVRGVIEVGTVEPLDEKAQTLFAQVVESIGIAFEGVKQRTALDKALKDSQVLNEELQTHQEELQETNEQLEEQTQALQSSRREVEERNRKLELAQDELNERAEQLSQSSRYKSEFLANMSHELRTPLNSILLLSKMIATGDMSEDEEQRSNAQVIHDAGTDLLSLINEVLDLSKIEAGKMAVHIEPIQVRAFAESFSALFKPQAESKGIGFEVDVEEGLPQQISSDPDRLQQVLRNFLSNAMKFTDEGGLKFRVERVTEALIKGIVGFGKLRDVMRQRPQDYIVFSVEDSGIGISAEKRQLVFEAFQQADGSTSRTYGGTGLGLSISMQIAEMLEGALALESSVAAADHGSTFSVIVPLYPSEALRSSAETTLRLEQQLTVAESTVDVAAAPVSGELNDDQKITSPKDQGILLVVEDDPVFAKLLIAQGRKNNYKVIHAASGTEAVRMAEHYLPTAILLDIQLPIMDGWGVLRHLKKNSETSHIPVHVFSGMDESQFGYRLGAAQYLVKPVDPQQLDNAFKTIEEHLSTKVRQLLVVEDNEIERDSIIKLLECERDVHCTGVGTGVEALDALRSNQYDAFILDLKLPDMDGYQVLDQMAEDEAIERIPTIVYTGKDLSLEEEKKLRMYAESIVLKSADSPARLLEETSIFLHRVRSELSAEKQKMISEVINVEEKFQGRVVLLVDDDIRNTFALSAVLRKRGLEVMTAADGQQALDLLDEQGEVIDVVLMDIMMPVMDGYEAMRHIRNDERFKMLPVIALTAKALKEDRDLCIAAGASDYMTKPIDYDQLFSLIRVWISTLAK